MSAMEVIFYYTTAEGLSLNEVPEHEHPRGPWYWTARAFFTFQKLGIPCEIRTGPEFPNTGIVFAFPDHIPQNLEVREGRFVVSFRADRELRFDVDCEIVQSRGQLSRFDPTNFLIPRFYLPAMLQEGIQPRKAEGSRFQKIGYLGAPENLDSQLKDARFAEFLETIGCELVVRENPVGWTNYADLDAIVAIRSFSKRSVRNKPANKLINSWLGGCIPILGKEFEFAQLGNNGEDYFEVTSMDELKRILRSLSEDLNFREKIYSNCRRRAEEYSKDIIFEYWRGYVTNEIIPKIQTAIQRKFQLRALRQIRLIFRKGLVFLRFLKSKIR